MGSGGRGVGINWKKPGKILLKVTSRQKRRADTVMWRRIWLKLIKVRSAWWKQNTLNAV